MDSNESKLDRIEARIGIISETGIRQQCTLEALTRTVEEHVKRSDALEAKLGPIERHVWFVEGALKVLGSGTILSVLGRVLWNWLRTNV